MQPVSQVSDVLLPGIKSHPTACTTNVRSWRSFATHRFRVIDDLLQRRNDGSGGNRNVNVSHLLTRKTKRKGAGGKGAELFACIDQQKSEGAKEAKVKVFQSRSRSQGKMVLDNTLNAELQNRCICSRDKGGARTRTQGA